MPERRDEAEDRCVGQFPSGAILEKDVTCKKCRVRMKELKGHIYHKKRKWKCPRCNRVRMQEQK